MFDRWLRRRLRLSPPTWENVWNARLEALEKVFGPSSDNVYHGVVPLSVGAEAGAADVVIFEKSRYGGVVYVTADLTGSPDVAQPPNALGQYELVMCTREPAQWAASLIASLAAYSLSRPLEPADTMDAGARLPGSALKVLLFTPMLECPFSFRGDSFHLMLCLGITDAEFALRREDPVRLLDLLCASDVYPFTDPSRKSLC